MAQYEQASTMLYLASTDLDATCEAVLNRGESIAFVGAGAGLKEASFTNGVLGAFTDVASGDKYTDAVTGLTAYIGTADVVQDTSLAGVIISMNKMIPPAPTRAEAIALYKISAQTLTYDDNGGTGEPSAVSSINISGTSVFTVSATAPTYTGHTFLGWATTDSAVVAKYVAGDTIAVTSDGVTLYAVWGTA